MWMWLLVKASSIPQYIFLMSCSWEGPRLKLLKAAGLMHFMTRGTIVSLTPTSFSSMSGNNMLHRCLTALDLSVRWTQSAIWRSPQIKTIVKTQWKSITVRISRWMCSPGMVPWHTNGTVQGYLNIFYAYLINYPRQSDVCLVFHRLVPSCLYYLDCAFHILARICNMVAAHIKS